MTSGVMISDVHVDSWTMWRPRFAEVEHAVLSSAHFAIARKASFWAFLGDWCEADGGPAVFASLRLLVEVVEMLKSSGVVPILIAGNHDVVEDGSGTTTLTPLRGIRGIHLAEAPSIFTLKGGSTFFALPFTSASHGYDVEKQVRGWKTDQLQRPIVLSHLSIDGVQPGEETTEMRRGREVLLPRRAIAESLPGAACFSGHYHRRHLFEPEDGAPAVQIIGSPARFTRAERDHEPSFLYVNL